MAKCTGVRCPMQYGYKVEECNHTDCPYRTEPITNADRIRAMSDEELAKFLCSILNCESGKCPGIAYCASGNNGCADWLRQLVKDGENE